MNPAEERLLQQAAAALTAHYYDKGVRDRLLAGEVDASRAFALLDMAAASVAGPVAGKDPERWLAAVSSEPPGLPRSVAVFQALSEATGLPPQQWAKTFALAASPTSPPTRGSGPTALS